MDRGSPDPAVGCTTGGFTALVWTVVLQDLGLWMPPLGPLLAITAAAAFVTRVAPRIT